MKTNSTENPKKNSKKWKKWRHNKQGKTPNIISFDEEIVTKSEAESIVRNSENGINNNDVVSNNVDLKKKSKAKLDKDYSTAENEEYQNIEQNRAPSETLNKKRKKKMKTQIHDTESHYSVDGDVCPDGKILMPEEAIQTKSSTKKRKANQLESNLIEHKDVSDDVTSKKKRKQIQNLEPQESEEGSQTQSTESKKKESIREQKRKKHAQLMQENKLKAELASQEKALNYLSKWKHSRSEWKFEKLRQIWLQQNVYDTAKIPDEFWTTLLEYFSASKGKAKDIILREAIKIIEMENSDNPENLTKVARARDIVQYLQE